MFYNVLMRAWLDSVSHLHLRQHNRSTRPPEVPAGASSLGVSFVCPQRCCTCRGLHSAPLQHPAWATPSRELTTASRWKVPVPSVARGTTLAFLTPLSSSTPLAHSLEIIDSSPLHAPQPLPLGSLLHLPPRVHPCSRMLSVLPLGGLIHVCV